MALRVLLADDNPTFRNVVRRFLESLPATEVVAEAVNGREALNQAAAEHPDLVLLDIGMPVMNGLDAARQMRRWSTPPLIVFLSMHGNQAYRDAAAAAGASAYINKADFFDELPRVLERLQQAH